MQDSDNTDKKYNQKYDGKTVAMEEQLIVVGDNSITIDVEGIKNDTGQGENHVLRGDDDIRGRSDSLDSDIVGLAELGLVDPLADECDLSHIEMPVVGDSTDEEREADDDDNMSSCCSDSADFKECTTLLPDEENLDSSKIAALSSAFSSYISSPKHNKRSLRQSTIQQDDVNPNMGQFLLPLVTEQLPVQDVNTNVERDHSVIEVLAAEAKRFKKAGDEMSALAWRILGEYHALENTHKPGTNPGEESTSLKEDEEERQQVMQLISKCITEDETLVIFQELNKEIQDREGEQTQGILSKLLEEDTGTDKVNNDKLKKFSDTRLVKSVLCCINGDVESRENAESSAGAGATPTSTGRMSHPITPDTGEGDSEGEKTFKFLDNSPLRSTLEQYMMMQIVSREAEAEQNYRLLRELGGITSNNTNALAGNSLHFSSTSPEESAQRIFDCDTVNTTSRFIDLDDTPDGGNADKTLCPGGCGNLKHCRRYRNIGANRSPPPCKSDVASKHTSAIEEDEGIVEEVEIGSGDEGEQDGAEMDKDKLESSEDEELGRLVDCHSGWWELRSLLCGVWRAADVGGLACKNVAVATLPPCHCCRCSHPMLRKLPNEVEDACECQQQKCRSCDSKRLLKQLWGGKVLGKIPPECCCQERRSTRVHHSCIVRLFFKDPAIAPVDFDLSKTEFERHDLEVDEENRKFLEDCHRRYLEGEEDIPRGDEDVVPLCDRCRCKCGGAKFYCPKVRDKTIKHNVDNFTRLAPQLLILRLDALCSALCAWHGAHLSRILAGGAVMTFLKELWRRAAAMRNGGIALSGILGPSRRRLATVCGRLLAPHQYLSGVYRGWADRAAATRVVHLSMLQLLGKAPPQTVEALHSFSSLLSMMNEAETLRGDVTTFLGNYHQYEHDEFLISLRLRLMLAQRKNLAIARFLGLLGDDPCELKGEKDCESSIVARRLSECLPTDPAELDEFKRIVQAMLLYHSSGGGISQLPTKASRMLSGEGTVREERCSHSTSCNECSGLSHGSSDDKTNKIKCEDDKQQADVRHSTECSALSEECTAKSHRLHSAAVMKRRQELEKEFVQREKSRIINNFVNALNSTHYKDDMLGSALFQDMNISSEITNRPRPIKRKFKTNDISEETNNMSGDNNSQMLSATTSVSLRMKPGCHKAGMKPNRISKSVKGRYVKSIRRASIGHMSEVVRKEQTPIMKTITSSPKAVRTLTKRGRSVSLYSETRRYLESAIRDFESGCPMNTVAMSGSDNVLRWYSMPDMSSRHSDTLDSSISSTAEAFASLSIDSDVSKQKKSSQLNEYEKRCTKELNSNLKGLTSKLIPELFVPSPSSVDPCIDIQLKKDFDVYVKDKDKSPSTVSNKETWEEKYLRMQMCECLEKMELLGLDGGDREQKCECVNPVDTITDDNNLPSSPLQQSSSTDLDTTTNENSANDIMAQEQNILKNFIDHEIESKKDIDLALDDLRLTQNLPFLEISQDTNEKQQKDKLNMKINLSPKGCVYKESNEKDKVEIEISSHLNDIIREHGIESDSLKHLLDPMNLIKTFGSKNLWNVPDDFSLLTPETIKQLKEVRQARIKKQTCGKRKNCKKNSECFKGFSDKAQFQATMMEDPTKEEIMTEMLGHRHKKKGFKNAKEFEAKLLTASLQVVMRKVLQVLMPCEEDAEFENVTTSTKYDVKVGNEIDGCNIDDYWDGIKSQFTCWRAFTLEQYWNLPENCRDPTIKVDCLRCKPPQDHDKKASIKKLQSVTSKVITIDPLKAKSYLTPGEHALFVERLQAVNKDYVDKLLKQNLTGEDWIFAMNELQNLERKLKSAVKDKSGNCTGSNKIAQETREAELLAGRGLSKLINQFSKKTKDTKQDFNSKSTKSSTSLDTSKVEKNNIGPVVVAALAPNMDSVCGVDTCVEGAEKTRVSKCKDPPIVSQSNGFQADCTENVGEATACGALSSNSSHGCQPGHNVDTANCKTEKMDVATKVGSATTRDPKFVNEDLLTGFRLGQEAAKRALAMEIQNKSPSQNTAVEVEQHHQQQPSQAVVAAKSNDDSGNTRSTTCAPAPHNNGSIGCKVQQHHHHHQHTCNQRDMEACANHNSSDSGSRCSQHAATARGTGTNNSANTNGSASGGNDQPCNCCYCTVFGHAPPVTTPVSKNFNETRERLRSILNRKKQRCRPGSSISSQGGDSDTSDTKTKGEETPSIIPIIPTVKPDPLPISTIPKQKPTQAAGTVQSKPQQQHVPSKVVPTQTNNSKPTQITKSSTQTQPQCMPNDVQKPNLPLKLKIKQGDGHMPTEDTIKQETAIVMSTTCKDTAKNGLSKDTINIQNISTANKVNDVTKVKETSIKNNSTKTDVGVAKVVSCTVVKKETSNGIQKQDNSVDKDQEKDVNEQNSRNAKKYKMAAVVNESKGIQTDKPRSQSLQPTGNPPVHYGGNIQKTGPQPLQTQHQVKKGMEQNRAKAGSTPRPPDVQHSASNTTSRDCSVFSTSTVCSGCSVDPRDLDMLIDFIEGPGSVMDKIKKKAKKARQKAKKMVEKLEAKLAKFEVKAAQLRAESNKLDKLLVATVGKKKKPNKKGKKKGENEVEDESVVALRRTAREYRDKAAQAEKELEDGRRMLNRVAKALLLIGSTEDISQLPEIIAVKEQVSLMSSLEEKEELEPASSIVPQHLQVANYNNTNTNTIRQLPQHNPGLSSLDQILSKSLQTQNVTSGGAPSQCMVTIKRVVMPESGEPSVTITPKGSDKPIYTFQNHAATMSQQIQQHEQIQNNKKSQAPTWESTLAQINSLSQGKKKKENVDKNKKVDNKQKAENRSVCSDLLELKNVDTETETGLSKKQRKLLAKKHRQEQEEMLQDERSTLTQKGASKKNKRELHTQQETEEDPDPEKIVLSMKQLKTAVERALEAMDSDVSGKKLPGKGKLKDNAKEFIEKVVSKVEETKKATASQSIPNGSKKRVDKVVDISEVVLGSFTGKIASATNKQNQSQKNNQQMGKNVNQKESSNQKAINQVVQVTGGKKQKQKQRDSGVNNEGLKVVSGVGVIQPSKKNQVTSVHHRSTPLDKKPSNMRGVPVPQQDVLHQQRERHLTQLNANYMDKVNMNSDITIQLANENENNACSGGVNEMNIKPGGPVSCSIMEQLRNGVQVPDLKLPPGITLTWVDPNKKQPNPTPKAAIPVVKLSSVAPEYRPTPPVVNPPPLIMVDTKTIPHNKDPKTQVAQSTQVPNQPQDSSNKSKSKKSKKKCKKPLSNLIQASETSTHSHQRIEEQQQPMMVTLRNPMFHPTLPSVSVSSVQSGKRVSESIPIPDPIPMPPNATQCQATITPTSNGMFTIRNPLMSMVHQQNMMAMKEAPNAPLVLMSSNQMKDHNVPGAIADNNNCNTSNNHQQITSPKMTTNANSEFLQQNLSFTPDKENRSYSLFKLNSDVSSPTNTVINQRCQESNVCPSPIGSKTNKTPPTPMNVVRQLDFNSTMNVATSGWQDCPENASAPPEGGPPGFYTPFGQADSDKLFGSLLFHKSTRDDHDLISNCVDMGLMPNNDQCLKNNANRAEYRTQPTPVGYGAKNTSLWNQPTSASSFFQPSANTNSYNTCMNPNYSQIRLSHSSSSSSGLMTGSVISSGTNSVYDSVSNSSSNSPADANSTGHEPSTDITNSTIQQSSPDGRNYGDFSPYVSVLQQQPQTVNNSNHNFNAFGRVTDTPGTADRMAELLAANRDRLNELGWYTMGNQMKQHNASDIFNQLSQETRLNSDMTYYNTQPVQNTSTANNFSPNSNNTNTEAFRQVTSAKLNVDTLQLSEESGLSATFAPYGAIGQGKQQSIPVIDEGQTMKNLGAIGSHRSGLAPNGLRQEDYYPGDSRGIFAPDQTISDLSELESAERDIELFKRFHFYFEPPKNKPKIALNLKDIKTREKR